MAQDIPVEAMDAPSRPDQEPLSPRQAQLHRAARVLRWGGIGNGVLGLFILIASIVAGASTAPDFFISAHNLLISNLIVADDVALFAVALLLFFNTSGLLMLMVGVLAQEIWAVAGIVIFSLINAVLGLWLGYTLAIVALIPALWALAIVARDLRAFRLNPMMLRELRGRMRGARAFVVITVYLGLMSAFTLLLYFIYVPLTRLSGAAVTGELGRVLFLGVVGIEMLLIIFIAPAFTAGAITGERERKTFDLLMTTLLPSASFVFGKLASALSYILLLLLAAIPLQSIAFLFGGVGETEVAIAFVILGMTALTLGALGMFFSSITHRTLTASVRSYTIAMIVVFGLPIVASVFLGFYNNALTGVSSGLNTSPILEAAAIYVGLIVASLNPVTAALFSQVMLSQHQQVAFITVTLASDGSKIPLVSPWIVFTVLYLVVTAILLMLAINRMKNVQAD